MTEETKKRLRSREWFDIPGDPSATALHIERYTNFGISVAELRSGKPVIGIAQTGSDLVPVRARKVSFPCFYLIPSQRGI
jgi:dihydroxy-acid dehydratase